MTTSGLLPATQAPLHLGDASPIAEGSSRWVYEHPENPGQLVKVLKYHWAGSSAEALLHPARVIKSRFKFARFMREVHHFVALTEQAQDPMVDHLPTFNGLVQTDRGYGMIVERLSDKNGQLAPTLKKLIRTGRFQPDYAEPLELFIEHMLSSPVVIGDLNLKNLVLTRRDDQRVFALIDGMGDSTLIPVLAMSRALNNRRKRFFAERLRSKLQQALAAT